jgi:hypothetical protein
MGANLGARAEDGKTAIHIACIRGDVDTSATLLSQHDEDKKRISIENDTQEPAPRDTDFDDMELHLSQHGTEICLLHLAILFDSGPLVKFLIQSSGADVHQSLEIVQANHDRGDEWYSGLEQYLPPIALALRLPLDVAQKMIRLLVDLGCSCEEMVNEHTSALQSCIASRPGLLEAYFDADPEGSARAAAAVFFKSELNNDTGDTIVSTPLLTAIQARDTDIALRLLENGAKAILPFDTFVHVMNTEVDFLTSVTQPIVLAVEEELPRLAAALIIQYGVDVNPLTPNGWKAVHGRAVPEGAIPESLFDCVHHRIESLEAWIRAPYESRREKPAEQEPMRENAFFFSDYAKDSYSYYSVDLMLDKERDRFETYHAMPKQRTIVHNPTAAFKKKLATVKSMLSEFLVLRDCLRDRSAKPFLALHPQVVDHEQVSPGTNSSSDYGRNWDPHIDHSYDFPDTYGRNPNRCSRDYPNNYVNLFEAVWRGDIATVKRLTLLAGEDSEDSEGDIFGHGSPPLAIAVADTHGDSPFTIALYLGHLELAKTIYWIAEAQYEPAVHRTGKWGSSIYEFDNSEDEESAESDIVESFYFDVERSYDGDSDANDIEGGRSAVESDEDASEAKSDADVCVQRLEDLTALLVDDDIFPCNVSGVRTSVASPVSPALMFAWRCPATVRRRNEDATIESFGRQEIHPRNMTAMALHRNDLRALSCILGLAEMPIKTVIDRSAEARMPSMTTHSG